MEFTIQSKTGLVDQAITPLEKRFKPICQQYGLDFRQIKLCLREALDNAIIHGNLEVGTGIKNISWKQYQEKLKEKENSLQGEMKVVIRFQVYPDRFEFEIEDRGKGFTPPPRQAPDFSQPGILLGDGGRGIPIIRGFMDEVSWNDKGNLIRMVKYLKKQKGQQ